LKTHSGELAADFASTSRQTVPAMYLAQFARHKELPAYYGAGLILYCDRLLYRPPVNSVISICCRYT